MSMWNKSRIVIHTADRKKNFNAFSSFETSEFVTKLRITLEIYRILITSRSVFIRFWTVYIVKFQSLLYSACLFHVKSVSLQINKELRGTIFAEEGWCKRYNDLLQAGRLMVSISMKEWNFPFSTSILTGSGTHGLLVNIPGVKRSWHEVDYPALLTPMFWLVKASPPFRPIPLRHVAKRLLIFVFKEFVVNICIITISSSMEGK